MNMTNPTHWSLRASRVQIEDAVAEAKLEILNDIANGTVAADVKDFSDLHEYVDANGYGGFFERRSNWYTEDIEAVQSDLDAWLIERSKA
jgi:hypothetical protein